MTERTITIEPNPDAPRDLQEAATKYWESDGADEYGMPYFTYTADETRLEDWSHAAYLAAAAGVTATLSDATCIMCDGPLTLTARSTITYEVLDTGRGTCRSCSTNPALQPGIDKALTLERFKERTAGRVSAEQAAVEAEHRREILRDGYPASSNADRVAEADPLAIIATLAILNANTRRPGSATIFMPLTEATQLAVPAAPDRETGLALVREALGNDLIRVDAERTPIDSIDWSTNEDGTVNCGRIFVDYVHCTAPDGDIGDLHERVLHAAGNIVSSAGCIPAEVADIVPDLIVGEAVRYVDFIWRSSLPNPLDDFGDEVRTALVRASEVLSIGQLYSCIWRAERTALSLLDERPIPRSKQPRAMATILVDRINKAIESDDERDRRSFDENHRLPLSPVTSVIFRVVLDLDPMTATMRDIDAKDAQLRGSGLPVLMETHDLLVNHLRTSSGWLGEDFRVAVQSCVYEGSTVLGDTPQAVMVLMSAAHTYDRLAGPIGENEAAIATAQALLLADRPELGGDIGTTALHAILMSMASNSVIQEPPCPHT